MRALNLVWLCVSCVWAQPVPTVNFLEEACRRHPDSVVCKDGRPIDLTKLDLSIKRNLGGSPAAAAAQGLRVPEDWRWANPRAALFVSIRVKEFFTSGFLTDAIRSAVPPEAAGALDPSMLSTAMNGIDEARIAVTPSNRRDQPDVVVLLLGDPSASALRAPAVRQIAPGAVLLGEPVR
jgi:hypothetical protein